MITKYHQIYVDIYPDKNNPDAQTKNKVEWFIANSMRGETKYATNFLYNLTRSAANGKSTASKIYPNVLPIYWAEISKDAFKSKNKFHHKKFFNYRTSRHI